MKTILLLNGTEAKVVKVWYQYGRTTWRVEFAGLKGCIAEIDGERFVEVEKPQTRRYENG